MKEKVIEYLKKLGFEVRGRETPGSYFGDAVKGKIKITYWKKGIREGNLEIHYSEKVDKQINRLVKGFEEINAKIVDAEEYGGIILSAEKYIKIENYQEISEIIKKIEQMKETFEKKLER